MIFCLKWCAMEKDVFSLDNYVYNLPQELIAQKPLSKRDEARLLFVNRKTEELQEYRFKDIVKFVEAGDVLVINDTKVIRARLWARRFSGGKVEILFLKKIDDYRIEALLRPARRIKIGEILIGDNRERIEIEILDRSSQGIWIVKFRKKVDEVISKMGCVPLPPYIKKETEEYNYQTVFAEKEGAIASPTAGLHFTPELLRKIKDEGVKIARITLHCGLPTFRPIKTQDIRDHIMDEEFFIVSEESARIINEAKLKNKKIFAVGTTSVRSLESASEFKDGKFFVVPKSGYTNLYIYPGYKFKIIDALITNFHTPCSTNLVLVATFCGLKLIKKAYNYAITSRFRFFSFGDAMLIV